MLEELIKKYEDKMNNALEVRSLCNEKEQAFYRNDQTFHDCYEILQDINKLKEKISNGIDENIKSMENMVFRKGGFVSNQEYLKYQIIGTNKE